VTRIYFLHIPKAGGTSIQSFLRTLYKPAEICPPPSDGIWRAVRAVNARRYGLITGHFDTDFVREIREPGIVLCMLRNPYDRIRSLYDFWRSYTWQHIGEKLPLTNGPRFAKRASCHEFVSAGNAFIRRRVWNAATRQLLGSRYEELAEKQDQAAFEAFEVLKSFDWFGISEFSKESLQRLARSLKISPPQEIPRLNQTYEDACEFGRERVTKTSLLRAERELIAATNRADILLYNLALERFLANPASTCNGMFDIRNRTNGSTSYPPVLQPSAPAVMVDTKRRTVDPPGKTELALTDSDRSS
jgi:Sulfotransferase family